MAPVCINSCESCEEETPDQAATTIFFSEYGEGSSNNKYIEIYNPTDAEISLDQYVILGNYNGNPWSEGFTFAAGATIETGSVYVIANASASDAIQALADEVLAYADPWYTAAFNGDDVRALAQIVGTDTTILDIIGTLDGGDPGSGWDVAGVTEATKDHTLMRKPGVTAGNEGNWVYSAGINEDNSEWIVLNNDNWTNLGGHIETLDDDGILYVPSEYATIQEAIDAAWFGQTVQVAAGTYVENINFNGKNISVIGADQATTIIDGDSSEAVVMFRNGEARSALLKNFTITNGNASNNNESAGDGGVNCSGQRVVEFGCHLDERLMMA